MVSYPDSFLFLLKKQPIYSQQMEKTHHTHHPSQSIKDIRYLEVVSYYQTHHPRIIYNDVSELRGYLSISSHVCA